ncbi:MAG: tRNA-dihydrouridine synthase family protein, partial [Kiritimatiellae bacterium]|nr:tRNA-dihydrouridine synthase family protein [Kiritimatiellia bacterium]
MKTPPVWLAPLRGVTLAPFRKRLVERFGGISAVMAPFVPLSSSGAGSVPVRVFSDLMGLGGTAAMTVPQVIGRDPDALRQAAAVLRGMGFTRLNLNCGCPWKFVARKGRGSGLLENPANLSRMLEAGCEAMPGGFSVKVRLGYHSAETLESLAPVFNSFPIERIFIHPRTGVQMYGGVADIEAFARVYPLFAAPVVYNGDVFSPADAEAIAARFPKLDGIMIGRGLCARPDLAERIAAGGASAPSPAPRRERIAEFAAALYDDYARTLHGPAPLLGRMKELWSWLHLSFEDGD